MGKKKRRVTQHMMEEYSESVFRTILPKEWVIHDYKPDYGIDKVVEIFKYINHKTDVAETLGELFFVQLKCIKETKIEKVKVYHRDNIEKKPLVESREEPPQEIEVIKFSLETSELVTVQSMGYAIPVMLVLVGYDTGRTFFVCLNDLIDKVILPKDPKYAEKGTKTIYIPASNEIKNNTEALVPLRFYAKRAKLFSAFMKFEYQCSELDYDIPHCMNGLSDIPIKKVLHFITILEQLDIWFDCEMWGIIKIYYQELLDVKLALSNISDKTINEFLKKRGTSETKELNDLTKKFIFITSIPSLWQRLRSLSHVYEEMCREWFLPTYLGSIL